MFKSFFGGRGDVQLQKKIKLTNWTTKIDTPEPTNPAFLKKI